MPLSPPEQQIILAIFLMAALHGLMLVWMGFTRVPALFLFPVKNPKSQKQVLESLPRWARWPADNYNNLSEAPTTFFAVAIAIILIQTADELDAILCLSYVGIRFLHSVFQATVNFIPVRFGLFALSWVVLIGLIGRHLMSMLGL